MPKPNIERGEAFMKAVVKASLYALFAIGVRSQANIDKFIVAFTESLEKNLEIAGITPAPKGVSTVGQEVETPSGPVTDVTESPVTSDLGEKDLIRVIIKNALTRKALNDAGIYTVNQLLTRMQKKDLIEIKGIAKKSAENIKEAVAKWNLAQS